MATDTQANAAVVEAFTAAVVTTFQELADTEVVLRATAIASSAIPSADVIATIALRRQSPGLLICAFPASVLDTLARRYLPPTVDLTSDLLDDTAGEFTNVIAGQAKTILKGTAYHYTLSTPIMTRDRCVVPPASPIGIVLHFDCDAGQFSLWVNVEAEISS